MTAPHTNMGIADHLAQRATEQPDKSALTIPNGRGWSSLSYQNLNQAATEVADGLAHLGVFRNERVLVLVKPSFDLYITLFGLLRLGAIPVLVDPGMGLGPVFEVISSSAPTAMIAIAPVHIIKCIRSSPFKSVRLAVTTGPRLLGGDTTLKQVRLLGQKNPRREQTRLTPSSEAAIVFTSGSTGTPKGVSFLNSMFSSVVEVLRNGYRLDASQTTVETFAAFALIDIALGMSVVIPRMNLSKPATAKPANLVKALTDHRAEVMFGSPVVLAKVTKACTEGGITLPHLQKVLTGVAPVPCQLHRDLQEVAPNATLLVNYGATECLTATATDSEAVLGDGWTGTRAGDGTLVGAALPGMEIGIIRVEEDAVLAVDETNRLPCGEIGEIVIAGPVASPRYIDRPEANQMAKIPDAERGFWHRSGDLGWLDDAGRLWFCGRKAHRVPVLGGFIPTVPLEGLFNQHPGIRRSALVGLIAGDYEEPVLIIEATADGQLSYADRTEILAMTSGTRWEGIVTQVVQHSPFPLDARHNAKIKRDVLKQWLNTQYNRNDQ